MHYRTMRRHPPKDTMKTMLPAILLLTAMAAHCAPGPPSHLALHAALLPPVSLTRALSDGESALKGMSVTEENALLDALQKAGMSERVLRVAVARPGAVPVALIKVQAGDAQSRLFSVAQTERDAVLALGTAFSVVSQLEHVDFWAVVPELGEDGLEWHRPVFSVAAGRNQYRRWVNGGRTDREFLCSLSAVRYDPVFTRHAPDWPEAAPNMPRTAYTVHRLADQWRGMVTEGQNALNGNPWRQSQVRVAMGGSPNGPYVALTIDDGPHPLITPLFLEVLRRENVKATFFVVGEKAEEFPGLIREIANEGHELGNHTYSHRRFSSLPPEEVYAELRGCSRIVGALTGRQTQFMRPPGGDYTADVVSIAESVGLATALWTHNTGDWAKPEPTAIAYHATHELGAGDIILMHQGDMKSVLALPMIIERVRARGLQPVPLSRVAVNGAVSKLSPEQAVAQRSRLRLTE